MAIDRRREAAGGVPGRLPPAAEENGALPPGDAAASAPLGGRAGPGGGGDIQPLPAPHAAGGPHPSLLLLDYDGSVLPFLGGLGGGYQKTLVLLTWIPALFIGFSQFSDSFLLDQPNFWCRGDSKGAEPAGVTATGRWGGGDLANWTSPPTTPFSTAAWGTAGPLGNGSGAEGGDAPPLPSPPDKGDNASNCDCHAWNYGIRTGLVQNVVSKWDLVCDNAWKVHVAKFSLLVGLIFGYLITGCIADWFGRRPVLLFSVIFILVFGLTVALSVNVTMFSTLRFFEGFCLAGVILTLYALRIELCPPGRRFLITMVASFVATAGQLLMPGLAALCRDWQVLQALIICPFLLMLLYWSIFPESLRWLVATHQFASAKKLILRFTQKNRMNPESDIKGVMPELEKELSRRPKKVCIVKVVGTRNLWKNIVVLCVNSDRKIQPASRLRNERQCQGQVLHHLLHRGHVRLPCSGEPQRVLLCRDHSHSNKVRRPGAGAGQCGLRHADGAHHRAAQPEGLLPAPHHLRLLHAHLHHLPPAASREPGPEPARKHPRRRALHAPAPAAAQARGAAAPAHQRRAQGLLGAARRGRRGRRAAGRHHGQRRAAHVAGPWGRTGLSVATGGPTLLRPAWGPPRSPCLRKRTLQTTLRRLSSLPLNVCIYFGHFYKKHFIPFPSRISKWSHLLGKRDAVAEDTL
uniref:Solute carrier family 22 member 23 n=1 Tax=Balaenoptera musculus TaxID=9771 RepID=A0A8C0CT03_BALMU